MMRLPKPPIELTSGGLYPASPDLMKKLTFPDRYDDQFELYKLVEIGGKAHLLAPRNMCPPCERDLRDDGDIVYFDNHFKPLKPEQPRVIKESVALLQADQSHIISAPTGFGKTYVGCAIAAHIGRRTIVVTTKSDILEQWIKAAKDVLGLDDENIGILGAGESSSAGKPFVVALVHSALKGPERFTQADFDGFGLAIFDEVHRMPADTFSQTLWHLNAKLRVGMSATAERKDGRSLVFRAHIGEVRVRATEEVEIPKVIMVRGKWACPRVMRNGKIIALPHQHGKIMHVLKTMVDCKERNLQIIRFVKQAREKGRTILVFSELIAHLHELDKLLRLEGLGDDIGHYGGSANLKGNKAAKQHEQEKAKLKPIILTTFRMCSEGTDLPWVDTCVLGMPRADVVQIVGRIRREFPGKKSPVVFDIMDLDSNVLKDYSNARQKWYRNIGAETRFVV